MRWHRTVLQWQRSGCEHYEPNPDQYGLYPLSYLRRGVRATVYTENDNIFLRFNTVRSFFGKSSQRRRKCIQAFAISTLFRFPSSPSVFPLMDSCRHLMTKPKHVHTIPTFAYSNHDLVAYMRRIHSSIVSFIHSLILHSSYILNLIIPTPNKNIIISISLSIHTVGSYLSS